MSTNRRTDGKNTYTLPSPDSYPYQWLWDSCFHAIILSHIDPQIGQQELLSISKWQMKNGMLPHMMYWKNSTENSFPKINWGAKSTSTITQPPMLAYSAWEIYKITNDKKFLRKILPVITKQHQYLLRKRDPRRHSLVGLVNPDESGEDNSPRFDKSLGLPAKQQIDENFQKRLQLIEKFRKASFRIKGQIDKEHWVRDVPFNAILAENLRIEADIAKELGKMDIEHTADLEAQRVQKAMRKFMLEDEIMWSTSGLNYRPIRIKTWAIFAPLFSGSLTSDEAEILVERHLKNPKEFLSKYSVPTVAMDEPAFDPVGFWRGPVWMATNWFIYKGLLRYGFEEEAQRIKEDSIKLIEMSGLREQYNPMTGEGMGARNFTWGGLILDM